MGAPNHHPYSFFGFLFFFPFGPYLLQEK